MAEIIENGRRYLISGHFATLLSSCTIRGSNQNTPPCKIRKSIVYVRGRDREKERGGRGGGGEGRGGREEKLCCTMYTCVCVAVFRVFQSGGMEREREWEVGREKRREGGERQREGERGGRERQTEGGTEKEGGRRRRKRQTDRQTDREIQRN